MTFDGTLNIQKWEKQVPLSECKIKGGYKTEHHRASFNMDQEPGGLLLQGDLQARRWAPCGYRDPHCDNCGGEVPSPAAGQGELLPVLSLPSAKGKQELRQGETPPTLSTSYYKFYIGSQNYRYEVTDIRGNSQVS